MSAYTDIIKEERCKTICFHNLTNLLVDKQSKQLNKAIKESIGQINLSFNQIDR